MLSSLLHSPNSVTHSSTVQCSTYNAFKITDKKIKIAGGVYMWVKIHYFHVYISHTNSDITIIYAAILCSAKI